MKTLMRNGRDRRSENPLWVTRRKSACFCLGPIRGSHQGQRPKRPHSKAEYMTVISPILANVYLHYVFDLWTHRWRRKATGDVIVIRYADDTIVGFRHEHEAKAFLHDLQERMRKFELALHPAKTRLIRFGRHAAKQRENLGEGKPR